MRELKHFPGYVDQNGITILHYDFMDKWDNGISDTIKAIVVQNPHRQNTIFDTNDIPKTEIINLPLPYLYYFILLVDNPWGIDARIEALGCSLSLVDINTKTINVLPLPNTGTNLYTCSEEYQYKDKKLRASLFKDKIDKSTLMILTKAVINDFWLEPFAYHEAISSAHKKLYKWAIGNSTVDKHIKIDVYRAWSKLKLKDLDSQPWLTQPVPKSIVNLWLKDIEINE